MAAKKNGAAGEKKMTKAEAVRQALKKLGRKAKPTALKNYIQDTFNIEMSTDHISTAKGDIKRKAKKKRAAGKAPASKEQPTKAAAGNGSASVDLDDILKLQKLVKSVGAAHLQTLIDVMTK